MYYISMPIDHPPILILTPGHHITPASFPGHFSINSLEPMKHRRTGGTIDVANFLGQEFKGASDAAWTDTVPSSIPCLRPFNSQSTPEIEKLYPLEEDF